MGCQLMTEREEELTIKAIVSSVKDIKKLNARAYKFLYLCNGFIAHYNLAGFQDHYSYHSLKNDLIQNANSNQYSNFRQGERDYDYYMQKKRIYNAVLSKIK